MDSEIKKALACFSCNVETEESTQHFIFHTFLEETGDLLADVLERCLLLPQNDQLQATNPVLCGKCCSLFQELAICEKKMLTLRRDIWALYTAAITSRTDDVSQFIRGIATQTDFEDDNDDDNEPFNNEDVVVSVDYKSEADAEESEIKDENELKIAEIDVSPSKKWWKMRGKFFNSTEEPTSDPAETQVEEQDKDHEGGLWRQCSKCSSRFNNVSEYNTHVKSHDVTSAKPSSEGKSKTQYDCRLCGKKLKSKPGASYHAKTHNFEVDKNFNLKEIFRVFVNGVEEADEPFEPSTVIIIHEENESSSDDELPLAKRRKEFLFEKIKQDLKSEETPKSKRSSSKQALKTLKSCAEVKVVKIKKPVKIERVPAVPEQMFPAEFADNPDDPDAKPDDDFLNHDDSDDDNLVNNSASKDWSTMNSWFKSRGVEESTDESNKPEDLIAHLAGPRPRGRPRSRQIPLSTLIKMKEKHKRDFLPPIKEPKYKCDVCNKMWKTRGELNAHRTTHSEARPYICEICGQAYKHKPALDVHVGMHRGIYEHQCPYCKKAFTQKGALQRHLPIHTGDLPYQCELCGKRFVHRTSFSIHTMAHTGVRNIKCEVCNMGVLSKSHLRRHMRIHSGEKPYDCPTCGKAFAERYNLVAHQRIHDPNPTGLTRTQKRKKIFCRLCNTVFERRHKLEEHMVVAHNKVVEETSQPQQRSNSYDGTEMYTPQRFAAPESVVTKVSPEQMIVKKEEPPSVDLSMRGVHTVRSDVLRSTTEVPRGLELLRMANGIVESGHTWGYINGAT